MAELYVVGFGEPIIRYAYHVPRVGDRIELREKRDGEDNPPTALSGDVVGVTWCDGNNGAVRIEVLPDG